jgi:hypothetical protein
LFARFYPLLCLQSSVTRCHKANCLISSFSSVPKVV